MILMDDQIIGALQIVKFRGEVISRISLVNFQKKVYQRMKW